jgi:type IV pilus assembly protein PilV
MRKQQSGVLLLEALIAILIFSLGILGVIGMQASAVAANRDAQYRTDAGLLANELIGQMWSANRIGANLQARFQGDCDDALVACSHVVDGDLYLAWRARVRATLPGADVNDPIVYVGPVDPLWAPPSGCAPGGPLGTIGPPQTSTPVCIVVRWMPPNETVPHSYRVVVQII